jgi:formylglycine-generating enzyme required for sulfatase activity
MKGIFSVVVAVGAFCALGEMTAKTAWTQRWPWDTKVDIDFTLSGGEKCDVAVTASFTTNGVAGAVDLERAGAEGDFWELEPGVHHLVWDPAAAGFDVAEIKDFAVTVTPIENAAAARRWLVLSLRDGTWEYRAEEPDGGWGDEYKTAKMVFRRIPAGPFTSGLSSEEAAYLDAADATSNQYYLEKKTRTITHDYYIAIYKTTAGQHARVLNASATSTDKTPHINSNVYYPYLRGSNNVDNINWPTTRFAVKKGSIIDKFRSRFGNRFWIDLPTSAQWEKAARAGTDTFWYNGGTVGTPYSECTNLVNAIAYSCINPEVAQYSKVAVGSYLANQYGLCDVVGMRPEYMLDGYSSAEPPSSEIIDPIGAYNPTRRVIRGQHNQFNHGIRYHTIAQYSLENIDNTAANTYEAFRFAIHLRPPQSFGGKWK